ncbi:MAG: YigZ family protein [Candidatus Fimenecus sp.]
MEYKTVKHSASDEFTEKRSRFIGYVRPVTTVDEANAFITEIQKKHWDAKHNVYAYILRDGNVKRYSDDGEPQGTAGVPTLDVLEKSGVTDVAVVVTRYFGGILLGGGGLVRAYSHAAHLALAAGEIITMGLCSIIAVEAEYPFYAKLLPYLEKTAAKIVDTDFSDKVCVTLSIDSALEADFCAKIFDFSGGQVTPQKIGEKFAEK